MLQPDNFVISNISKHLAQKEKHLTLFLESNLRAVLHLNNVNKTKQQNKKEEKSIPNDKTHTTILQSKK